MGGGGEELPSSSPSRPAIVYRFSRLYPGPWKTCATCSTPSPEKYAIRTHYYYASLAGDNLGLREVRSASMS
jgi:hypothetical protein